MLKGSINHIAITVSDLDTAMSFFEPLLEFLGFTLGKAGAYAGTRLVVNLHEENKTAFNIWEAKLAHDFQVYEPGLHHVAFNASSHAEVDAICQLVKEFGGEILDGPGEFPFAVGGYYAVYFLGPDGIKFEVVYMPELDGP